MVTSTVAASQAKTDEKDKQSAPVPSADVNMLDTTSTLEQNALEAEGESSSVKIRSVLADYSKEVTRGRQMELSALEAMDVAMTVKSISASGRLPARSRDDGLTGTGSGGQWDGGETPRERNWL